MTHTRKHPWKFLSTSLALCSSLLWLGAGAPSAHAEPIDPVKPWLERHAVPLWTTEPGGPRCDLQPLRYMVGDASVVGLGEATHGSHEFYTVKQRILEFLVEEMGFTTLAVEGDWSMGVRLNDYVLHGIGDPASILAEESPHIRMWPTEEVVELLEWMRAYNANPRHPRKVHFAGIDFTYVSPAIYDKVLGYIGAHHPELLAEARALYQELRPTTDAWTYYFNHYPNLPSSTRQRYADQAQRVYALLEQRPAPGDDYAWTLQHARVITQFTRNQALEEQRFNDRDASMAENARWLNEHGGKLVLWAHNMHVANGAFSEAGMKTLGTHMREQFGGKYRTVGFSFRDGSFNSALNELDGEWRTFSVGAPLPGSYNDTFSGVGLQDYFVDLRRAPRSGPVRDWLFSPRGLVTLGSTFSYDAPKEAFYIQGPLGVWFDVMIHLQHVTAARPLP